MTVNQTFTKEVTYEFNYGGLTNSVDMYIDDITKRRYVATSPSPTPKQMLVTDFLGTEDSYQTITATYVSEFTYYDIASEWNVYKVLYHLPDVDQYCTCEFYTTDYESNSIMHKNNGLTMLPSL